MTTIYDLKTDYRDLSDEDKITLVKEIRQRRLETKPARTATAKKRREKKVKNLSAIERMSVEELDLLIKKLEDSRGKARHRPERSEE